MEGDNEGGGRTGEDSRGGSPWLWWFLPVEDFSKAEGPTMDGFEEAADWLCPKLFAAP